MPTNPGVSEVQDKNGVVADIEAKRFDGTRTVNIQGDVTASQTWNGDSSYPLTLNASIGAKKVTTDKINDKAVQAQQIDDGAVGLTQIATNAMNGTVQDNDSKLATHASVKTYVDSQISGQGTYLGKHTVAEINAFVTDNLHNGDRVMASDSGTINLGPGGVGFDVIAGEDLILYKSGSTVQWDTMDGNFKTKQNAVSKAGSTTKTVTAFSQNENGDADVTYEEIQRASTSQEGLVQLTDSHASTSTTTAATPKNVKEAYDLANGKYSKPSGGIPKSDLASGVQASLDKADSALQPTGDGKDLTSTVETVNNYTNPGSTATALKTLFGKIWNFIGRLRTSWQTTPDDSHFPSEKLVKDSLDTKADKVSGATNGNFAALDSNGNLTDSGKKASDFELVTNKVSAWQGTPDNTHYPSEKLVKDGLDGKVDIANIAKMVQVATAGTAAGSSVQPVYVDTNGVATPIEYRTWISNRGSGTSISALPMGWYKAEGILLLTPGETPFYVELSGLDALGFIDLWINQFYSNSPLQIHVQANIFSSGQKGLKILERSGYNAKNIDEVILRSNSQFTETKIYFHVTRNDNYFRWRSSADISNSNFAILTEAQYNALTTVIRDTVVVPDVGSCAMSKRAIQRGSYNVLDDGDVKSTYSSTGTDPVNGTAVAAALATSLTDVAYVANQSGGGGNLNKTINGTTTAVLTFMNDSEAVAIWDDAKTAAANA